MASNVKNKKTQGAKTYGVFYITTVEIKVTGGSYYSFFYVTRTAEVNLPLNAICLSVKISQKRNTLAQCTIPFYVCMYGFLGLVGTAPHPVPSPTWKCPFKSQLVCKDQKLCPWKSCNILIY